MNFSPALSSARTFSMCLREAISRSGSIGEMFSRSTRCTGGTPPVCRRMSRIFSRVAVSSNLPPDCLPRVLALWTAQGSQSLAGDKASMKQSSQSILPRCSRPSPAGMGALLRMHSMMAS